MHCPGCGRQGSTDQHFCRSCGMDLEAVSEFIAGQQPVAKSSPPSSGLAQTDEPRLLTRMVWGLVMCIVGVFIGVMGGRILHVNLVTVVGALLALAGGFVFLSVILSAARASQRPVQSKALAEPKTTKQLLPEGFPEAIPSVTERTTELLKAEKTTSPHSRH